VCRLFGFRSAVPSKTHRSLMEAENALSLQATRHPDGWGIGWFVDEDAYIIKSAAAAHACERFRKASSRLESHTFIVHVRRATVGKQDHLNAHPFRFGRWLFAHNGTVFQFESLKNWLHERIEPSFHQLILGDTDSETLFYYLLSQLRKNGIDPTGRIPADAENIGAVIRASLLALNARAEELELERPILNVLITDGRMFVAHRAGMPLFLSTQKNSCRDFDSCADVDKFCMEKVRPEKTPVNHMLVASEPIDEKENIWEELPDGSTLTLDEGFMLQSVAPPPRWQAPILPERYRITDS